MVIEEKLRRFCDRCGKEIHLCRFDVAMFKAERPIIRGSIIRRDIKVGECKPYPSLEFDFCTECADEFESWIKSKRMEPGRDHDIRRKQL